MRAFLAVPVTPPAHEAVGTLLARLRAAIPGVSWVDPATVHLTLHFFEELDEARLGEVLAAMAPVAATARPFDLRPAGLGSFPPHGRLRVLWLGLDDPVRPLVDLAAATSAALAPLGFDVARRPYRPHVTLGRPRRVGRDGLQAWEAEVAARPALPPFTARDIVLYESRGGHHVRARLPLGGPA